MAMQGDWSEEARTTPHTFVNAYTVALFIISFLAAAMIFSHEMIIELSRQEADSEVVIAVLRFVQAFEALLALAAVTVAILRCRRSRLAHPTTSAISMVLTIWFPIGTAVFIWWLVSIRQRESSLAT